MFEVGEQIFYKECELCQGIILAKQIYARETYYLVRFSLADDDAHKQWCKEYELTTDLR
jgi:hypothetical protein